MNKKNPRRLLRGKNLYRQSASRWQVTYTIQKISPEDEAS